MDTNSENVTVIDGYSLAIPFERIIASLIDVVVYVVIYALLFSLLWLVDLSWLGGIAILYLLLRDSIPFLNYQSLGKKVMKLRVIKTNDAIKINLMISLKRNFIFLPNILLMWGPSYFYIASTITSILILIELYLLYTSTDTQRLGDMLADTLVIENNL